MSGEQLERRRAAARGWTTRASKALQDLLANPDVTRVQLEDAVEEFDRRLATLDTVQAELELEISDPDLLEADLDKADSFRSATRAARVQAAQKLVDLDKAADQARKSSDDSGGSSAVSTCANVKLPRLELPKFSGELTQWQSFWDLFVAMVDDSTLPAISKFTYLQSLLEGEAKSVIQGLSLTAINYTVACKLLKERFGKPERIIFAHIQALLGLSMPSKPQGSKCYVSALRKLQDDLLTHIRSLEALGVSGSEYGLFLTPVILSRLPSDIRLEWSREGSGHESDLSWLMTFLTKEIERRERSDSFKDVPTTGGTDNRSVREPEKRKQPPSSASALQAFSETSSVGCGFCNKPHASERCFKVLQLSPSERQEKVRSAELCFVCLKKGHISKGCKAKCVRCKGNHNVLLCFKGNSLPKGSEKVNVGQPAKEGEGERGNTTVRPGEFVGISHSSHNSNVPLKQMCSVLPTAKVKVCGNNGKYSEATLLFDSGSDKSYVSSKFVRKVRPTWVSSEQISYSAFGGSSSKSTHCNIYNLNLVDVNGAVLSLLAAEVPSICAPLLRPSVPADNLHAFKSVQFADEYVQDRELTIDILIGLDAYWKFIIPNSCLQVEGLVAQETLFGWVLSGTCASVHEGNVGFSQMLCINETSLHKFWDLESVGICHQEVNAVDNNPVLKTFSETVKFKDGRYEVALPWKSVSDKCSLQNNEKLAKRRLSCLMHKFKTDSKLQEEYDAVFKSYEQEGIIEEVPESEMNGPYPTFYLPHRPVIREISTTSKVRPVFDASAVSYNGISLNHCLESGPSLNPLLVEVLIRFRRWKVALTADITKAFLQINVRKEDRDVHRFLWNINGNIHTMRFVRVPFGNKSSPFLLNATLKHHLKGFPDSEVITELNENMYVDDWLSGADSAEEACVKFNEARSVLSKASMSLSKWKSNCRPLIDKFNENLEPSMYAETKILGLQWCLTKDSFSFGCLDLRNHEVASTKRAVLSVISKVFDPLGLICPVTMMAKILFQDIWRLGLSWDETLPAELLVQFQRWVQNTKVLNSWQVCRCYIPELSWKTFTCRHVEMHAFGDASEKGYGACVYLRVPITDGSFKVSLVLSRGRVAPIKKMSVPRLELMGALLCARLSVFVKTALHLTDVQMYCWTDSTVALSWIKGDPNRWKTFVANRVTEIQSLIPPVQWHHSPGKDNPADLISRGAFAEDLISSTLWLNGPPWLSEHTASLLQDEVPVTLSIPDELFPNSGTVTCLSAEFTPVEIDFSRWGHFTKALKCFAWVIRFVNNCKPGAVKSTGPLSYTELDQAKTKLFFCVQREKYSQEITNLTLDKSLPKGSAIRKFNPFLDENGLLRSKGRLDQADISYESKYPLIIPSSHIAKLLVSFQHTFLNHAGVSTLISTLRSCYLIVGLRKLAKRVCRECITCRRHHSQACCQPVAPLPGLRVNSAPPFTVTGVDYAGPLFCIDFPSKKLYILLFTCGVVRALHLELTDSMSHDDCLLAFRRFSARRGLPSVIYSDNAKTFISMSNEMHQFFGSLAPQWKFVVPHAPWWGGWWERLVRSVKLALRKTLGRKCLTRCELETTLQEIEACINSRPLTFAAEDPNSVNPLTPSHFLIGRTAGFQIELAERGDYQLPKVSSKDLCERESLRQQQLDRFWKLWVSDYLLNLPPTITGFVPRCNLEKGSVVLIRDDKSPRLRWPLGVVVDLFPGKDGVIRSVNVKTSRGVICRPVQKLHNLELSSADVTTCDPQDTTPLTDTSPAYAQDFSNAHSTTQSSTYVSRTGRIVKPPDKLDL